MKIDNFSQGIWDVQERSISPTSGELTRMWIPKNDHVRSGGFLEQEQLQKGFGYT